MKKQICLLQAPSDVTKLTSMSIFQAGYEVIYFNCLNDLDKYLQKNIPHMLIIDSDINELDILNYIKDLKLIRKFYKLPIIMLGSSIDHLYKSLALDLGADDYINKPISYVELVSRINAIFRRINPKLDIITHQGISIDIKERQVFVNDNLISLTFKEYEILKLFMLNINRAITREAIYDKIWESKNTTNTRTIDMHIKNLRQKVCLSEENPVITTIPKVGYRFDVKKDQ